MTNETQPALRLASKCLYLRTTLGNAPEAGLLNLCTHIIRDGRECVGPFLDDHETTCGLWEPRADAAKTPAR